MDALAALPSYALALIALVLVVQLSLMVWALVDVSRRPASRVRGPKWLWVIVILFGEIVGPLVYLLVARLPESVDVAAPTSTTDRVPTAADVLYGPVPAAGPGGTADADAPAAEPDSGAE